MDAKDAFVLDGSITMIWGFDDEADEYAEAILSRMPDLQRAMSRLSGRSKWATLYLLASRRNASRQQNPPASWPSSTLSRSPSMARR